MSIKGTEFTKVVADLIKEDLAIIDEIIEEDIEVLADVGNPEKLIGKKYSDWDTNDFQLLAQAYGTSENSLLSKFIFKREYEEVKELERTEG